MKETTTETNKLWEETEKLDIVLDAALSNTEHKSSRHEQKITGAISRVLYFDAELSRFMIKNPILDDEMILVSRTTVHVDKAAIGKEVLVTFDGGNVSAPIITGVIDSINLNPSPDDVGITKSATLDNEKSDNEKLVLSAEKQIVLKCGESSITLTKEGKVLIKGKFLSSRSSGVNRIKGGSVSIN